jgi:hypothetical protein
MKLGEFIRSNREAGKQWQEFLQAKQANDILSASIGADGILDDAADLESVTASAGLGEYQDEGARYRAFISNRYSEYGRNLIVMSRAMQSVLHLYFRDRMEHRLREISNGTYTDQDAHKRALAERLELRAVLEAMDKPVREPFPRSVLAALKMTEEALRREFRLARSNL